MVLFNTLVPIFIVVVGLSSAYKISNEIPKSSAASRMILLTILKNWLSAKSGLMKTIDGFFMVLTVASTGYEKAQTPVTTNREISFIKHRFI
ncbi:hypothetical protein GCM10009133_16650 [Cocleimonas flava]